MSKPTLQVIIAGTRPGRVGKKVAAWLFIGHDHVDHAIDATYASLVKLPAERSRGD